MRAHLCILSSSSCSVRHCGGNFPTISPAPLVNPSSSLCSRFIFLRGHPGAGLTKPQALRAPHTQMLSAVGYPAPCPLLLPSGPSGCSVVLSPSIPAVDQHPVDVTTEMSPISAVTSTALAPHCSFYLASLSLSPCPQGDEKPSEVLVGFCVKSEHPSMD